MEVLSLDLCYLGIPDHQLVILGCDGLVTRQCICNFVQGDTLLCEALGDVACRGRVLCRCSGPPARLLLLRLVSGTRYVVFVLGISLPRGEERVLNMKKPSVKISIGKSHCYAHSHPGRVPLLSVGRLSRVKLRFGPSLLVLLGQCPCMLTLDVLGIEGVVLLRIVLEDGCKRGPDLCPLSPSLGGRLLVDHLLGSDRPCRVRLAEVVWMGVRCTDVGDHALVHFLCVVLGEDAVLPRQRLGPEVGLEVVPPLLHSMNSVALEREAVVVDEDLSDRPPGSVQLQGVDARRLNMEPKPQFN